MSPTQAPQAPPNTKATANTVPQDFVDSMSKMESGQYMPPSWNDMTPSEVMMHGIEQIPKGLADMLEHLPETIYGGFHLASDALSGKASNVMQDLKPMAQPYMTTARGIGAGIAPSHVTAPTGEDWDKATQGATQQAAGLIGSEAVRIPGVARAISGVSGNVGSKLFAAAQAAKAMGSPTVAAILNLAGHVLGGAPEAGAAAGGAAAGPPPTPQYSWGPKGPINAQFVEPPTPPYTDAEMVHRAPPPQQLGGQQQALSGATPPGQQALNPAPGVVLPGGSPRPLPSDPSLPSHYANVPAEAPAAPPATMGRVHLGNEGSILSKKQEVIPQTKVHAAVKDETTSKFRKMTPEEEAAYHQQWLASRTNSGRSVSAEPGPEAQPRTVPKPPKPPKGKS